MDGGINRGVMGRFVRNEVFGGQNGLDWFTFLFAVCCSRIFSSVFNFKIRDLLFRVLGVIERLTPRF